jgi:hypothetical protein
MLRVWVAVLVALVPVRAFAQGGGEGETPAAPPTADQPAPPADAAPAPEGAPAAPESTAAMPAEYPPDPPEAAKPNSFPEGWRLMLSDLTIFRLNPLGLETRARFGVQKKLYPSAKKITENNFFFLGTFPKLNPASAQISLGGELQPASIFNVRVYYELQKFFGTFGFLQSFASANSNYSDNNLKDLADMPSREPEAKTVRHFSVQPQVQLKFGKIAVRSLLQLDYWDFKTREVLIYEPTFDTLLPKQGWTMSTDTDVLYVPGNGLAAGLRHTYVKPFYSSDHFIDSADENAYDGQNAHHRLGLFAAYTIKDKGPSTFNKPTAILILSFYLKHKYRAGEPDELDPLHDSDDYRTRAFPYLILGFAFESDLLAIQPQ